MTRRRDLVSSGVWLVLGAVFCAGAVHYGLFRRGIPGPGFFPFLAGLGLFLLSSIQLISRLVGAKRKEESFPFFPERASWKRLALVIGSLVFYTVALQYLGFLVTTFLFVTVLLAIEPKGWTTILATGILATGFSYLLFEVLLRVQLPRGVFRLWGVF